MNEVVMAIRHERCGIYQILCVPTGKCYIGSSKAIYARWYNHRCMMRQGLSVCTRLQRAWTKYGEKAFRFSILEECDPFILREREQFHINELKPQFNLIHVDPTFATGPSKAKTPEARKAEKAAYDRLHRVEQTARKRERRQNETREQRADRLKKKRQWHHRTKGRGDVDTAPRFSGEMLSAESRAKTSASLKEYNKQNPKPKNEPWIAEGISKTQWYRRIKWQTETPEQHEARNAEKRANYHANGDKEREKMRLRYRRSKETATGC